MSSGVNWALFPCLAFPFLFPGFQNSLETWHFNAYVTSDQIRRSYKLSAKKNKQKNKQLIAVRSLSGEQLLNYFDDLNWFELRQHLFAWGPTGKHWKFGQDKGRSIYRYQAFCTSTLFVFWSNFKFPFSLKVGRCIRTLDWNPTQHTFKACPAQLRSSSRLAELICFTSESSTLQRTVFRFIFWYEI